MATQPNSICTSALNPSPTATIEAPPKRRRQKPEKLLQPLTPKRPPRVVDCEVLVIRDSQGRARITMSVGNGGMAHFRMADNDGNMLASIAVAGNGQTSAVVVSDAAMKHQAHLVMHDFDRSGTHVFAGVTESNGDVSARFYIEDNKASTRIENASDNESAEGKAVAQ